MGLPQSAFIVAFKERFISAFGDGFEWREGQRGCNVAGFSTRVIELQRDGPSRRGETFELGDVSTVHQGVRIVVEFESGPVSASNVLKYWPYLTGALSLSPQEPLILLQFSNWSSYGSWRDLSNWTMKKIRDDPNCRIPFDGRQFDHMGRGAGIDLAIDWVDDRLNRGFFGRSNSSGEA